MASGKISAKDKEGRLTGEPKILVDTASIASYDTAKAHKPSPGGTKPPAMVMAPVPSWQTKKPPVPAKAPAAPAPAPVPGYLVLRLMDLSDQQLLHDIKAVLAGNAGPAEIYILVGGDTPKKIRLPFKVAI